MEAYVCVMSDQTFEASTCVLSPSPSGQALEAPTYMLPVSVRSGWRKASWHVRGSCVCPW